MTINEWIGVEGYLAQLEAVTQRVGDQALAMQLVSELARDRRTAIINAERENGHGQNGESGQKKEVRNPDAAATEAQLAMIKRLGGPVSEKLTRGEASEQIDLLMAKRR